MDELLRQAVRSRAGNRCEYCHLPEAHVLTPYQVEHVIARQHAGSGSLANLAYSCLRCNLHKGPSAVCSRIAYSDQKRPWCSYLLPAGEGAPQGRMRAELLALARKSPHPAVPARPRKRGSPRSPREKERRPRRACNSTVKRASPCFIVPASTAMDQRAVPLSLRTPVGPSSKMDLATCS